MINRILIILFIFLISCDNARESSVDFLEPQPTGIKDADSFNKKYRGTYLNTENNSKLEILTDKIIRTNTLPVQFSINDLDSSFKAKNPDTNQIRIELAKGLINVIRFKEDSAFATWTTLDTLFTISDNNICRFYKGSYFLNYTDDNYTWKVERMDLNKKKLTFGVIYPDSLFAMRPVNAVEPIKNDSGMVVNYRIKPTKKELKKLIKNNAFSVGEVWIKQ